MSDMKNNTMKLRYLFLVAVLALCSCNEDALPDNVIEDDNKIIIDLTWSIDGEDAPVESADLDLGIFNSSASTTPRASSEKLGDFESLELSSSVNNSDYFVKIKAFSIDVNKEVDYFVQVSNSDKSMNLQFSGTIEAGEEVSGLDWSSDQVVTVVKITKSNNQFTVEGI